MSLRDTREHENADDGSNRISRLELFSREEAVKKSERMEEEEKRRRKTEGEQGDSLI